MIVRIAAQTDTNEVSDVKIDCEDIKKKIAENHPEIVSYKEGQLARRVVAIPAEGPGVLKKKARSTYPAITLYFSTQMTFLIMEVAP